MAFWIPYRTWVVMATHISASSPAARWTVWPCRSRMHSLGTVYQKRRSKCMFRPQKYCLKKRQWLHWAGADLTANVNGKEIGTLHPFIIRKNATLSFGKSNIGARIYLAVGGGFALESWLNSYSTNTKAGAGGFKGRALQKGDQVGLKQKNDHVFADDAFVEVFPWFANVAELYVKHTIRFVPGLAYDLLDPVSKKNLQTKPCTITRESDRMGFRLQTEPLHLKKQEELISTAVTRGAIQLLPDGQMIILMADHQSTGGYPVIGYIASADFSSLAQLRAGESFLLEQTDLPCAETALLKQQMNLQQLQNACNFRLK
jgi:antagonist of KipI